MSIHEATADNSSVQGLKLEQAREFWNGDGGDIPSWRHTRRLIKNGELSESKVYVSGKYPYRFRLRHVWRCAKGSVCGAAIGALGTSVFAARFVNDLFPFYQQPSAYASVNIVACYIFYLAALVSYEASIDNTQRWFPKLSDINRLQFRLRPIFRGKKAAETVQKCES